MARRLPVYLLLDCSESMLGKPLDAVEAGLKSMISALKRDPHASETVHMSIITFDTKARIVLPLTDILKVRAPALPVHPGTAMGAALSLLYDSINRDVSKTTKSSKGDYKPIVFILTDGQPTDEWIQPAGRLNNVTPKIANIYAIGCGEEVDFSVMKKITENCIYLKNCSPQNLSDLFVWLSASVQSQSAEASSDLTVDLTKVPLRGDMVLVDSSSLPSVASRPRMFLHGRCQREKKLYLICYKFDPDSGIYFPEPSLPLPDDFFSEGKVASGEVNTSSFGGIQPCPYCGADSLSVCGNCGNIFCVREEESEAICPSCECHLKFDRSSGHFNIHSSKG